MRVKDVTKAIAESERFVSAAKEALARQHKAQIAKPAYTHEIWEYCQENAACKRASLDLSRALAKMRKS